jgi:hypothetical protein
MHLFQSHKGEGLASLHYSQSFPDNWWAPSICASVVHLCFYFLFNFHHLCCCSVIDLLLLPTTEVSGHVVLIIQLLVDFLWALYKVQTTQLCALLVWNEYWWWRGRMEPSCTHGGRLRVGSNFHRLLKWINYFLSLTWRMVPFWILNPLPSM